MFFCDYMSSKSIRPKQTIFIITFCIFFISGQFKNIPTLFNNAVTCTKFKPEIIKIFFGIFLGNHTIFNVAFIIRIKQLIQSAKCMPTAIISMDTAIHEPHGLKRFHIGFCRFCRNLSDIIRDLRIFFFQVRICLFFSKLLIKSAIPHFIPESRFPFNFCCCQKVFLFLVKCLIL